MTRIFITASLLALVLLGALSSMSKKNHVTFDTPITIVGISVRTTNVNNEGAQKMPALAERFFNENIPAKIAHKINETVYVVYTDYDAQGNYSATIGVPVPQGQAIPEGLVSKTILPGKYELFTAEGQYPQSVATMWEKISTTKLDRAYTTDFELYDSKFKCGEKLKANIYVAESFPHIDSTHLANKL